MSKRLELKIDCGNATFFDDGSNPSAAQDDDARRRECAAILKDAARRLERGFETGNLHDTNGNTVGTYRFINGRK